MMINYRIIRNIRFWFPYLSQNFKSLWSFLSGRNEFLSFVNEVTSVFGEELHNSAQLGERIDMVREVGTSSLQGMNGARLQLLSLGSQPCNPATEKGFWLYKHKKWIQINPTTNPKCFSLVLPVQTSLSRLSQLPGQAGYSLSQLKEGPITRWQFIKTLSISESCLGRMGRNCPGLLLSALAQPASWQKQDPSWLSAGQLWRVVPAPELFVGSAGGSLSIPTSGFSCPGPLWGLEHAVPVPLTCAGPVPKGALRSARPADGFLSQSFPGNQT